MNTKIDKLEHFLAVLFLVVCLSVSLYFLTCCISDSKVKVKEDPRMELLKNSQEELDILEKQLDIVKRIKCEN